MKNEITWSQETIDQFQIQFLAWYHRYKRNLPWRVNQDPYRIWISEIMLQQTRVDTVIDYYYRFMEKFPTIEQLAAAPEEELLKMWEGLGYYSRARNIQSAAKQIMERHQGQFPNTVEEISQLKGIGPYTTGAIASIAFGLPEPAIDGNIMRVVSRLFCIPEDIAKPSSRKVFDHYTRAILSPEEPGEMNQAFMDLGSAICTPKNPECEACPLQAFCQAYQEGNMTDFPVKTKKAKPKDVYYFAAAIENEQGEFWFEQREDQGLLAKMWHFPLEEVDQATFDQAYKQFQKEEIEQLSLIAEEEEQDPVLFDSLPVIWQTRHLGEVKHLFSHLRWHVLLFYGRTREAQAFENGQWIDKKAYEAYAFPKIQHKMWDEIAKNQKH
ncbi:MULTISPECIES: A/G-specific adenine glycosylase [Enterococcus]|uniref:Adenine DNA glycosylase n=1 Tax=Enterococcus sulfureus ATCC 49903 TaxID=1140003 RepID=S0NQD6_9ENTE|nr:A/G-specific adenine glycosylase [Enterococcus sulfureus]EOT47008.1 A/G-specific adenine glycosylase [Enterococcus sulfureus ATCC 49903]EOT83697.1 A/G-specific adenine glycosylase [Enterococcus sulfureus ATCC 49903]